MSIDRGDYRIEETMVEFDRLNKYEDSGGKTEEVGGRSR